MSIEPIVFNEQQKYFQIKINAGKNIFKSGGVIQLSDLEYEVQSATIEGEKYKVFFNEGRLCCTCPNFDKIKKYNNVGGICKHGFSVMEYLGLIR
jgi:hypothetical protein